MKTTGHWLGLVMLLPLAGCAGDDGDGAPRVGAGGTTATGGTGGAGSAGGGTGGAGGVSEGTAGEGSGGMQPTEPFTVKDGICRPAPMPGPEPVYQIESVFGHVGSMVAQGDTLYFAEFADFNDIPPRIAKLEGAGPPVTVVDGVRAGGLRIYGGVLHYVEEGQLKSFDLTTAGATPVVLNTVEGIVDYDAQHVIYDDETNIYAVPVAAADLTGAVTLHAAEGIYSVALAGDTLYLSSRDGVYRVGVDGTGVADVVPDEEFAFIEGIVTDGTSVYFEDSGTLSVVPVAGGEPRPFAKAGPGPFYPQTAAFSTVIPAGAVLYWADDHEGYGWSALDGASCGVLGTHDGIFAGGGALADSYFYASGDGTIYRVDRVD